jgi:coenzyme Q-binding protein COQ10
MPKLYKTATTHYSQQELFSLVADVEKYPEFLPFCTKIEVHESSNAHLVADMHIGYKGFSGAFRSKVLKDFPHTLTIEQTHGNLKHLRSLWTFHKNAVEMEKTGSTLQQLSRIEFMIDFEPSSWLVGKLITPLMEDMGHTIMQSFLQRASAVFER